jgi:hypothetical protein
MAPVSFGNGRVASKDASAIEDGALVTAEDCYYKANNPAPWKAQGRSEFNSSAEAGSIKGLRALIYDGATDVLVAHVGTTYREATLAATGTFGAAVSGLTGGTTLDSIHYNNEHILLNGVDRGRVRSSAGVYTLLGMLANTSAPTVSRDAGAGTGFTLTASSTIKYWVEERVKSGFTILRRNASTTAEVVTLTGDGTLDKPVITRPATVNSDATHWALYGTSTDGSFPTGAEIAEVAIGTTTIEDTRTGTDPVLPSGDDYEIVSATIAGLTFNVAKNGQPPILLQGDVFEDAICGFDQGDKSILRHSYTDNIHAWPSTHKIRAGDTKEEDEGIAFRTVGSVGVALLRDSAARINALPKPEDPAFQPERIRIQIPGAPGCVGPFACDVISRGEGSELVYVSPESLVATDGYEWETVGGDLDWPAEFTLASMATAVLIDNTHEARLELTATAANGSVYDWYFHYHRSHLKPAMGGGIAFKVTGPIKRASTCKTRAKLNGVTRIFSGHTNGKVYLEAGQVTDASGTTIAMKAETKDYYFAGIGAKSRMTRLYVHHQAAPGQTATVTVIAKNAKQDDGETPEQLDLTRREATPIRFDTNAEGHRFRFENSDTSGPVSLDYMIADIGEADKVRGQ